MIAYLYLGRSLIIIHLLVYIIWGLFPLLYTIIFFTLLGIAFYFNQRQFIYSPSNFLIKQGKRGLPKSPNDNQPPLRNPSEQQLNYNDIFVKNQIGIKLKGWHIKPKKQSKRIVVFFQGAGRNNIGTKLPFLKEFIQSTLSEVIYISYRGYSDNDGSPTEKGICSDGQAILEYAIKYKNQKAQDLNLYVLGRSLGGGVAIHTCSLKKFKKQIKGIILQNTFISMLQIAQSFVSWFKYIPFFLKDHWKSIDKIKDIEAPILFVRSSNDSLIKPYHMKTLMKKAQNSSFIMDHPIEGGKHHQAWRKDTKDYLRAINQFFDHPLVK